MKLFLLQKNTRFYFCIFTCIVLCSCGREAKMNLYNSTLKASIDFAKANEKGPSQITYNSKTGENIIIYTEYPFGDILFEDMGMDEVHSEFAEAPAKPSYGPKFAIGFGVEYISKGAKSKQGNTKIGLNYIEIPVHLMCHLPAGSSGSIYGGIGPYFAYGIGGSIKSTGFSQKSFGENNGGYKRFDAGLGLIIGYRLNMGLSADVFYDLGLVNTAYPSFDATSKNRCFGLNIGYSLGKIFGKEKKGK